MKSNSSKKTKQLTLRFSEKEFDEVVARAEAVGLSAYGLAKAAVQSFDAEPLEAKKLIREVKSLSTAEILEAVVLMAPIKAATTPEEIRAFQQIIEKEGAILELLRKMERSNNISMVDAHTLRMMISEVKNTLIFKINR